MVPDYMMCKSNDWKTDENECICVKTIRFTKMYQKVAHRRAGVGAREPRHDAFGEVHQLTLVLDVLLGAGKHDVALALLRAVLTLPCVVTAVGIFLKGYFGCSKLETLFRAQEYHQLKPVKCLQRIL